jgi:hypothetical protein
VIFLSGGSRSSASDRSSVAAPYRRGIRFDRERQCPAAEVAAFDFLIGYHVPCAYRPQCSSHTALRLVRVQVCNWNAGCFVAIR